MGSSGLVASSNAGSTLREMSMRNEGGAGGVLTLLTPLLGVAVPATACQLPGRLRDPGGITHTDDLARKNVQAAMPCHA